MLLLFFCSSFLCAQCYDCCMYVNKSMLLKMCQSLPSMQSIMTWFVVMRPIFNQKHLELKMWNWAFCQGTN